MAEKYISASEAAEKISNLTSIPLCDLVDIFADIPAADITEMRCAHWEFPVFTGSNDELDPRVKCSECGEIEAAFARWNYCPNCGARMDGDKSDG